MFASILHHSCGGWGNSALWEKEDRSQNSKIDAKKRTISPQHGMFCFTSRLLWGFLTYEMVREVPHQPLSLPHHWNMFAPTLTSGLLIK